LAAAAGSKTADDRYVWSVFLAISMSFWNERKGEIVAGEL